MKKISMLAAALVMMFGMFATSVSADQLQVRAADCCDGGACCDGGPCCN